jgi:A/G-specific adenine glycosylase
VLALPGIGRSTAGAICAFAFGQRHAILDGNVKRVLARHAGIEGWPGEPAVLAALWQVSVARLPPVADGPGQGDARARAEAGGVEDRLQEVTPDIGTYTQALMDLGAGPCARSRPRCGECPVSSDCTARLSGRIDAIPAPRPKRQVPRRNREVWLLVDRQRGVLLERRPPTGIWGGLWSLPETIDAPTEARIRSAPGVLQALAPIEHAFTHFRLTLEPLLVRMHLLDRPGEAVQVEAAEPARRWVAFDSLDAIALPAPIRVLLEALRSGDAARGLQLQLTGLQ